VGVQLALHLRRLFQAIPVICVLPKPLYVMVLTIQEVQGHSSLETTQ